MITPHTQPSFIDDIKNVAEETINKAEEIGEDSKDELVKAGKNAIKELESTYEKVEDEINNIRSELESVRKKFEKQFTSIKDDFISTMESFGDFSETVAKEIIERAQKLDFNFIQNLYKNLNVQRMYFHGSSKDLSSGIFPNFVIVTGVGNDRRCAEFQFNANQPEQSIADISGELFKLLTTDKAMPCDDLPPSPC